MGCARKILCLSVSRTRFECGLEGVQGTILLRWVVDASEMVKAGTTTVPSKPDVGGTGESRQLAGLRRSWRVKDQNHGPSHAAQILLADGSSDCSCYAAT